MSRHTDTDERTDVDYYLPGASIRSTDPGPVGRFLTRLFRRRGRF
ncbi:MULTISPECIES: hypothetical protein [Haloplanus]|jgi:hypothetical protein|nr:MULTISPECIES: hypothetical protein [Haloplanus]